MVVMVGGDVVCLAVPTTLAKATSSWLLMVAILLLFVDDQVKFVGMFSSGLFVSDCVVRIIILCSLELHCMMKFQRQFPILATTTVIGPET